MSHYTETIDLFWFNKKQITQYLEYLKSNHYCFAIKIRPFDPDSSDLNSRLKHLVKEAHDLGIIVADDQLNLYSHY